RERAANRRLRVLAGVLAVLVALALSTSFVAVRQSRAAAHEALAADARRVGAAALTEPDPQGSLMRAIAAARIDPSVATHESLHATLALRPELLHTSTLASGSNLTGAVALPQGLVTEDDSYAVNLLDPDRLVSIASTKALSRTAELPATPLAFSQR